MKKGLLTLCIAFFVVGCASARSASLERTVSEFRTAEGFDVVSVPRPLFGLVKWIARFSGGLDEDERQALLAVDGIRRLTVVDFEDAPADVKQRFVRRIERSLRKMDLVLEAKDEGEGIRIYGMDDGKTLRDCVLYSPEGTLICTSGRIDMDRLGELIGADR